MQRETDESASGNSEWINHVYRIRSPLHIFYHEKTGQMKAASQDQKNLFEKEGYLLRAILPPVYPELLGDRSFSETHRLRFPYVAGAMARGITSAKMVISMARCGMLGFFGAAGLSLEKIEEGLKEISGALDAQGLSWGSNLIHTPADLKQEEQIIDLYLRYGVRRVSASAFMSMTPAIVRYAVTGLRLDETGRARRKNYIFAKVSRLEVAEFFMAPPPGEILDSLQRKGLISAAEAQIARTLPVAEDITLESDSGGHTDHRPLGALFPAGVYLRDRLVQKYGYANPVRLGTAGGLGSPESVAAAFALGASYVLTGSVNQSAVESGASQEVKEMLAQVSFTDMASAPSADMFEIGARVQVLKRGTLFAARANFLYELYNRYGSFEEMPPETIARLEKDIFRKPVDEVIKETREYFEREEPRQAALLDRDPKQRMAMAFRWYLGLSSRWALDGNSERRSDYQVWCGPAMGAFNSWVKGSFLEKPENREVVQIALNLLEGAALITRAQQLRSCGVSVPSGVFHFVPRKLRTE